MALTDAQKQACARFRAKHPEKIRAHAEARKANNPDYFKRKSAEFREKNPEYSGSWYKKNAQRLVKKRAEYYSANKDNHKNNVKRWRDENPEAANAIYRNRRARKCAVGGSHNKGDIKDILNLQGHKCACCAKVLHDDYHVDHIMPIALGGHNGRRNLQILCQSCNLHKHAKHPIDFMRERGFLL